MSNTLSYKDYIGSVEVSEKDGVFFGRVLGMSSAIITYEGRDIESLVADFHDAVDDYIDMCEERGQEPEISHCEDLLLPR